MAPMHSFGDYIDRRSALPADSLCEAALAVFIHDPTCRAIAVARGQAPVGVVSREAFMARMETRGTADRPILEMIEHELLAVDIHEPAVPFVQRILATRAAALLGGFVVTEQGEYRGVCDLARLAPALMRAGRGGAMIERICA